MLSRTGCVVYAVVVLLTAVTSDRNMTRELELVPSDPEPLTLLKTKTAEVEVNFTLYCVHHSVTYSLTMTTSDPDVAEIQGQHAYDISCANATYPPYSDLTKNVGMSNGGLGSNQGGKPQGSDPASSYSLLSPRDLARLLPRVEGAMTFVLEAGVLGRTRLYIAASRRVQPGIELPDFLQLPWSTDDNGGVHAEASRGAGQDGKPEVAKGNSTASEGRPSSPAIDSEDAEHLLTHFVVTTERVSKVTDVVFRAVVAALVIASSAAVGLQTDLTMAKRVLRQPLAPVVGCLCQSLVLPLIAFALARTVSRGDPALALGILACGNSPGGLPSNAFTFILDGDAYLAVVMTTMSIIAAIATIPLWLFTLGATFHDDLTSVRLPFDRTLIIILILLIVPLFLGLFVRNKFQKVSEVILKGLKPLPFLTTLFLMTLGINTNIDIFLLYSGRALLTGCLLPYIGYFLGGVTGVILGQPFNRVKAIAIETGLRSTSVAYVLLVFSLPVPQCDVASAVPLASAIITPLPICLIGVPYVLYKKFCKRKKVTDKMIKCQPEEHGEVESDEKDVEKHSRMPLNASCEEKASSTETQTALKQSI